MLTKDVDIHWLDKLANRELWRQTDQEFVHNPAKKKKMELACTHDTAKCAVRRTYNNFGDWYFAAAAAGPRLWNTLPLN